jgi:hypothetical protein
MNSGVPASGTGNVFTTLPTSPIVPQVSMYGNTGDNYGWFTNFGQRPFSYTPPTGFLPLNTYNLPTPTILAGNQYMDATLYTGNGTSQSIVNSGSMQPDLVWEKRRDATQTFSNGIIDSVRGRAYSLVTNLTIADQTSTSTNDLTSFNSNGFSIGPSNNLSINDNGGTYVAWQWRANAGTNVSNTQGTITSTVSANTTAGFSIVTYTGTNASGNQSVGHGLGVAPSMIIAKSRTTTNGWVIYHSSLGSNAYIFFDTSASGTLSNYWGTGITSTTFGVYTGGAGGNNINAANMVAYCFAAISGYSAFGSYTGNGSSDGTFVYTGFRPAFLLIKRTDSAGGWYTYDDVRSTYNLNATILQPNLSDAEFIGTNNSYDFLSNGFKNRGTGGDNNASGGTYIYAAFAENPFKISRAR